MCLKSVYIVHTWLITGVHHKKSGELEHASEVVCWTVKPWVAIFVGCGTYWKLEFFANSTSDMTEPTRALPQNKTKKECLFTDFFGISLGGITIKAWEGDGSVFLDPDLKESMDWNLEK